MTTTPFITNGRKTAVNYTQATAITPSDALAPTSAFTFSAFWVGGAGNVTVYPLDGGTAVLIAGVAAGTLVPLAIRGVMATGTTATSIVGFA